MHISQKLGLGRWTAVAVTSAAFLLGLLSFSASALALPDGRTYEMVSPIYKGGYGANAIDAIAPDGESVAFVSLGAFSGDPSNNAITNDYISRRVEGAGWSTMPSSVPAALPQSGIQDFSTNMEFSLASGYPGLNVRNAYEEGTEYEYLLHRNDTPDTIENFQLVGKPLMGSTNSRSRSSRREVFLSIRIRVLIFRT